jgi:type VI secretion system secreted protein Hcp
MAVVDYFLKLEGVPGESQDDKHKGEIEIDSFSFGLSNSGSLAFGGGGGAGKVSFHDFSFSKRIDKASPELLKACATGKHLKEATVTARKAGGENRNNEFWKLTLTDVLVSSYRATGNRPPEPPPTNTIAAPVDTVGIVGPDLQDGVALRYRSVKQTVGPVEHITMFPAVTGNLLFDPVTQKFTVVETPNGILTVGRMAGAVNRGVQEYDVAQLIGLLTNPFGTASLHLMVKQIPPGPPTTPGLAKAASVQAGAEPHLANFDVILYTPADGTLTVEDLTRKGRPVGTLTVDPNGPLTSLDIDLTRFITRGNLAQFGIRIQLRGASVPNKDDEDDEGDDNKHEGNGPNNDRAHADGENDNKNDEHDDDKKRTPPPDVSASFMADLVFNSQ